MWITAPLSGLGALIIGIMLLLGLLFVVFGNALEVFAGKEGRVDHSLGGLEIIFRDSPFKDEFYINGIDGKVFWNRKDVGFAISITSQSIHLNTFIYFNRSYLKELSLYDVSVSIKTDLFETKLNQSYLSKNLSNAEFVFFKVDRVILGFLNKTCNALLNISSNNDPIDINHLLQEAKYITGKVQEIDRIKL